MAGLYSVVPTGQVVGTMTFLRLMTPVFMPETGILDRNYYKKTSENSSSE
jgi:hypothetical protein